MGFTKRLRKFTKGSHDVVMLPRFLPHTHCRRQSHKNSTCQFQFLDGVCNAVPVAMFNNRLLGKSKGSPLEALKATNTAPAAAD